MSLLNDFCIHSPCFVALLYGLNLHFLMLDSPCVSFDKCVTKVFFSQSRARCDPVVGALLPPPCVKLKDEMLPRKAIPDCSTSHFTLRGTNSVGVLNAYWEMEKYSDWSQAVPDGTGYVDHPEECK
jgi:hypothetical protein